MFGDDEFCQHHEGMKLFDEQYGTNTFPKEKQVDNESDAYLDKVRREAQKEIDEEDFRSAVDRYKIKLRERKWWHRLMPFKVLIVRRDSDG